MNGQDRNRMRANGRFQGDLGEELSYEEYNRFVAQKVNFLDSLIRMEEEPHEMDFEVESVSKILFQRTLFTFFEHGLEDMDEDCMLIIPSFLEFIYLSRFENNRKYFLHNVSKKLFEEFFDYIEPFLEMQACKADKFDCYDMLKFLYIALQEASYGKNLQMQLKHIEQLQRTELKAMGLVSPKILQGVRFEEELFQVH